MWKRQVKEPHIPDYIRRTIISVKEPEQDPFQTPPPVIDVEVTEKESGLKTAIKVLKGVAAIGTIAGLVAGFLEMMDRR